VDVCVTQRRDAVAQHRARVGVNDRQRQLALVVFGGGDAVSALLDEEGRPLLQPVVVERVDVARPEMPDGKLQLDVHRATAMCLRYCCHIPRTEVSVTRDSFDSTLRPPISTTDACAAAPCTPRCTNPVAAPSSSEMYPDGPTRFACLMRRSVIAASSLA